MPEPSLPVVVIGAGAAGMVAAIFASGGSRRVLLLERTRDGGRKILVSGGGRCNVLPSALQPARFVTDSSPNSLRKILLSWPLAEQKRFFEDEVGIPLALEEETGKLFPASDRARDVRDGLLRLASQRGVETVFDSVVEDVLPSEGSWVVRLREAQVIRASAVILATGGLSLPGTGSDGTGLRIARRLGHTVHETYPALTPLTADPPRHAALAGISLDVTLTPETPPLRKGRFETRGGFLFTHRGYSGPTVLDASHLAVRSRMAGGPPQSLFIGWTPLGPEEWDRRLREGAGNVAAPLRRALPDRLAETLLAEAGVDPARPLPQLRRDERRRLVDLLTRYPLPWTGDGGYAKAEVTGGGVALSEVDPRTLESRRHPGLFLCGEMLDAFGPIGGHNFAWAWATGRAAGLGSRRSD
ncbi:MAG: aminoacetone oxidase family FAD-binding enzyme [Acidobacteriota bacterium]